MSAGARRAGTVRAVLAAVLLAALVAVGQLTAGSAPAPRAEAVAVTGATAVCPGTPVTAGSAGTGAGTLAAGPLDGPPAALPLRAAGEVLAGVGQPVVVARGAVAAGLVVEHLSVTDQRTVRGLTGVRCGAPTTSAWFVGGASVVGESAELLLVNADPVPALVDVRAWSATGPVEQRPGRGLAVPARGRLVVPLDRLAPDRALLALHVTTNRGRVAPYVRHSRADGRTPRGLDFVPRSLPPAREVVVPGLPAGPGRRAVVVANPGEQDATVTLELTTGDGRLEPVELDVPAGTSVVEDVSGALARTPAAARLVSTQPVLAAALVDDAQDGAVRELSWAGSAAALTGPAPVPEVALSPPLEQALLVTALDGDAVVDVVPVAVRGADGTPVRDALPAPRRLQVPAGTTAVLALSSFVPAGSTTRLALEVRPVSGQAYAARYLRQRTGAGPLTALLPVTTPVARVPRPVVQADPLTR